MVNRVIENYFVGCLCEDIIHKMKVLNGKEVNYKIKRKKDTFDITFDVYVGKTANGSKLYSTHKININKHELPFIDKEYVNRIIKIFGE